jgi:hypothetical protein
MLASRSGLGCGIGPASGSGRVGAAVQGAAMGGDS